jgi:hypothetical protein
MAAHYSLEKILALYYAAEENGFAEFAGNVLSGQWHLWVERSLRIPTFFQSHHSMRNVPAHLCKYARIYFAQTLLRI